MQVVGLGQSGFRFESNEGIVYVDPYLTDHVASVHGSHLSRMLPAPVAPHSVTDADWVLLTHAHEDHTDPETIRPLSISSPASTFIGPGSVCTLLEQLGIARNRIWRAVEEWRSLTPAIDVRAVPAAHTEIRRDSEGSPECVGYLVRSQGRTIYHSGDTMPHQEIIDVVRNSGPIDYAFLPVNERNYYREAQGIIGNMSVREAFQMASDVGARTVIPIHWDLFHSNSTSREEIELIYRLIEPPFELRFVEAGVPQRLW